MRGSAVQWQYQSKTGFMNLSMRLPETPSNVYKSTRHLTPEYLNLHSHCCENFKPRNISLCSAHKRVVMSARGRHQ